MSVDSELRSLRQEVDALGSTVTQLVKALEQDDRLRERSDLIDQRERDRRHQEILVSLEKITKSYEAVGTALRDLPDRCVRYVEAKILELRREKFEARQSGVMVEPALLPPAPSVREPTSKIIALVEGKDNDSTALTAGQQKALVRVGKWLWRYKLHAGGVLIAIHWGWERLYTLLKLIK